MAEHGSDDDLARLDEITTTIDRLAGGDAAVAELMGADRDFHDLVARASQNRIVAAVSRDIREVLGTLWGLSALGADQARIVAGQHRAIADAIGAPRRRRGGRRDARHLQWAEGADLQGRPESRLDRVIRS